MTDKEKNKAALRNAATCLGLGYLAAVVLAPVAEAQGTGPATTLPSVTVEAPKVRNAASRPVRQAATRVASRPRRVARRTAPPAPSAPQPALGPAPAAVTNVNPAGSGSGPVNGYVARQAASGTKTDTPIIETPQSISVLPKEEIRDQDALTLTDALGYVPGVTTFASSFGRVSDNISLRGFDASGSNGTFLRDGLKTTAGVYDSTIEPYGVERIDIIKGAASVLYGQLGPGGVVNAVSKRPVLQPFGELNASFGSYSRKQLSGDFGGAITPDGVWSYRLTGLVRDSNTFIRDIPDDRTFIAPALTYAPTNDTSLTLLGYYQHDKTRFPAPLPFIGTGYPFANGLRIPRSTFLGEPSFDRFDTDSATLGYLFEHKVLPNLTIRQGLKYYQADTNWNYLTYGALTGSTITRGVSDRVETGRGLAVDTSAEVKFATGPVSHTAVAGVDYYRRFLNSDRFGGTAPPLNLLNPVYGRPVTVNFANAAGTSLNNGSGATNNQLGLYLQDQVKLLDKLVLLVGGRGDLSDTRTQTFRTGRVTNQSDSATTGRVGLVYLTDIGVAPYASYSTSFVPNIQTDRLGSPFRPTTGNQVEAGIRYQPPGTNILLSSAYFDIKQQNALTPDPVNPTFSVQTGEVRSQGAEFEARSQIGSLSLVASYTFDDFRITRSTVASQVGARQPFVPRNAASIWGLNDFTAFGLPGFSFGGGVRYVGETFLPGLAINAVNPHYVVFDLLIAENLGKLTPRLAGFEARLNIKNVTNDGYTVCTAFNGCRYGDPRTFVGTVSYRW